MQLSQYPVLWEEGRGTAYMCNAENLSQNEYLPLESPQPLNLPLEKVQIQAHFIDILGFSQDIWAGTRSATVPALSWTHFIFNLKPENKRKQTPRWGGTVAIQTPSSVSYSLSADQQKKSRITGDRTHWACIWSAVQLITAQMSGQCWMLRLETAGRSNWNSECKRQQNSPRCELAISLSLQFSPWGPIIYFL